MLQRCCTISIYLVIALLLVVPPATCSGDPLTPLREIRTSGGGTESAVEIIGSGPLTFSSSSMPQLLSITIDLPFTEPGTVRELIPVNSGLVAKVTVRKKILNDLPLTRVVIHLHQNAEYATRQEGQDRVVVSLRRSLAVTAAPSIEKKVSPAAPRETKASPGAGTVVAVRKVAITAVVVTPAGLEVKGDGPITDFKAFTLSDPGRLVIDIPGGSSTLSTVSLPENPWGILTARTGKHPDKIRLVLDRKKLPFPKYEIKKGDRELVIYLPRLAPVRSGASR